MLFRMESEIPPTIPLRLKIEINCFEHFNELGLVKIPFEMENSWFSGKCEITTYCLNELLGTKLRALYQRKKGRDLFDLYVALSEVSVDPMKYFVVTDVICPLPYSNRQPTSNSSTT